MKEPQIRNLKFDKEGTSLIRSLAKKTSRVTLTIHTNPRGVRLLEQMSAALQKLNRMEREIEEIKTKIAA